MKMHRETLRNYLHNQPLVQTIAQKHDIDTTKKALADATQTLRQVGVAESIAAVVQTKLAEYHEISQGYGRLLEDVFHVTWQMEAVIRKYIDCCDDDIDRLPEYVER